MIKSYKDLEVWQKSIELVKRIYLITKSFPSDETYGLMNQMRRAAVSIASNIAEGKTRQTKKEYIQFLYVTLGSTSELETQIVIAKELRYIDEKAEGDLLDKTDHISKMTRNLIKSLRSADEVREPLTANR
jgi:four helix bundle protein